MLIDGREPATPLRFCVHLGAGEGLALDDVVYSPQQLADLGAVTFYGVVELVQQRQGPEGVDHIAWVRVCRTVPESFQAPLPESSVFKAGQAEISTALHFDGMRRRLTLGSLSNAQTAYLNHDFLCGEKGAHVNISGISGVATKTSYALFLLYSLFHSEQAKRSRAVIFNVKSDDLLHLHRPNLLVGDREKAQYARLGLPCGPFPEVHYCPTVLWSLREFAEKRLFRFLFSDSQPPPNHDMIVDAIADRLHDAATSTVGPGLIVQGQSIERLGQICELLSKESDDPASPWFEKVTMQSRQALLRRLSGVYRKVEPLLSPAGGGFHYQSQLTVVDLHRLSERARAFVVGSVLHCIYEGRETQGPDHPHVYLVLDELNKYAPIHGNTALKEMLLDLAERGRSLGLILLGAEQTASEVEPRVVSNCSVRVTGRLESAESEKDHYGWLRGTLRERACLIQPGTMIVQQPELPTPLLIRFPFPAWATRAQEAG